MRAMQEWVPWKTFTSPGQVRERDGQVGGLAAPSTKSRSAMPWPWGGSAFAGTGIPQPSGRTGLRAVSTTQSALQRLPREPAGCKERTAQCADAPSQTCAKTTAPRANKQRLRRERAASSTNKKHIKKQQTITGK